MACNPTGRMRARWRALSKNHAPYPANLPQNKRATWDLKSEAEVTLARKLKILNKAPFLTETIDNVWDNWWRHRDQEQDWDQVWDKTQTVRRTTNCAVNAKKSWTYA